MYEAKSALLFPDTGLLIVLLKQNIRNNKVIGKVKERLNGVVIIKEYVEFRAKTYFVIAAGKIKANGLKKCCKA